MSSVASSYCFICRRLGRLCRKSGRKTFKLTPLVSVPLLRFHFSGIILRETIGGIATSVHVNFGAIASKSGFKSCSTVRDLAKGTSKGHEIEFSPLTTNMTLWLAPGPPETWEMTICSVCAVRMIWLCMKLSNEITVLSPTTPKGRTICEASESGLNRCKTFIKNLKTRKAQRSLKRSVFATFGMRPKAGKLLLVAQSVSRKRRRRKLIMKNCFLLAAAFYETIS